MTEILRAEREAAQAKADVIAERAERLGLRVPGLRIEDIARMVGASR